VAEETSASKAPSSTLSCAPPRKPLLVPGFEIPEEDVSIAVGLGREQLTTQSPSNVYVLTEEDIRHSGAVDLPTVLRHIPGMEVILMTAADFNVSTRGGIRFNPINCWC